MNTSPRPHSLIRLIAQDGEIIEDTLIRIGGLERDLAEATFLPEEALGVPVEHPASLASMVGTLAIIAALFVIASAYVYSFYVIRAHFR
ncbi:hypothetical protein HGP17_28310 [Rhizobium sp. P38BS-XIX]|uniref:hypothetical protein n=1 Tax=Rhizobium sp. P38BS-XIX TaxID=2726740 RepID=UPI001456DD3F|nr:hypothetical protein [Rhizobium sp. P38BS-XIX]NLS00752.1 hypothetical protein [Rhizobium sp. P38BS-XIX]